MQMPLDGLPYARPDLWRQGIRKQYGFSECACLLANVLARPINIRPYPRSEENHHEAQDDPQGGQGHRRYRFKVLRDRPPGKDCRQTEYCGGEHVADAEHKNGDNGRGLRFDPEH